MKRHATGFRTALCVAAGGLLAAAATAAPFGSAFTYQGELRVDGTAPTGAYDLRFTPYPDAAGGAPLGTAVVIEDVAVVEGIFTTRVDFGAGFFVGDAVHVELAVRPGASADPNAFEALGPRQELTATPYALKTAPGSVTDIELADKAVGPSQLQPDAVAGAQVADASITSDDIAQNSITSDDVQDLSLVAADVDAASFEQTFWRVGGNAGTAGLVLGTKDAAPLALRSDVGVTINGARINNNTELTVRGSAATAEPNVDISLWPRGGETLFNLSSFGTTSETARFAIHAVDTQPAFTGFLQRLIMDFDGALGLGAMPNPLARLHVRRLANGLDASDLPEAMELVLEDEDAQLGLYSRNTGGAGSVLAFGELDAAGTLVNQWGVVRETSGVGGTLQLTYGSALATAANPTLFHFERHGGLGIGASPVNAGTELHVHGGPELPGGAADLSLQPQGGSAFYNWSAAGTNTTDTTLALQFAGGAFIYEPRLRFAANGAVGVGQYAGLGFADSFVFADDSTATPFSGSAANQFVVRASNGAALNGPPLQTNNELTVHGSALGEQAEFAMVQGGSEVSIVAVVDGAGSTSTRYRLLERDESGVGTVFQSRLWIEGNGFVGLNGSFGSPAFPLVVGTGGSANGNGAHLTTGGTWTNASSRTLKEAFTAIDVEDVLARVLALPVTRWRYRDEREAWHLGPVAEEFHAAFGLGGDARYIGSVDADGVALAAIQGLARRSAAQAEALAVENAALRASLEALARRVEKLEAGTAR